MYDKRYLVVAAAALVAMMARPSDARDRIALNDIISSTTCAIKVEIDVNLDREPQKIKMLKCQQNTEQWCEVNGIQKSNCCQYTANDRQMECVEITDTVVVFNKKENREDTQDVSVGCTCLIRPITYASDLPPPP